jgi:hypothetical protein
MIRFNLGKFIEKLEAKEGKRITLKQLSERSGCDRNVLSRILSRPDIIPSANVIDKLVQFFFREIARDSSKPHLDRSRMGALIREFVSVFPDDAEYWRGIPRSFGENPTVSLSDLWLLYTEFSVGERTNPPKLTEVRSSLKAKLLDADQNRQAGLDIDVSLSPEELDLLREQLPQNMGGKGA